MKKRLGVNFLAALSMKIKSYELRRAYWIGKFMRFRLTSSIDSEATLMLSMLEFLVRKLQSPIIVKELNTPEFCKILQTKLEVKNSSLRDKIEDLVNLCVEKHPSNSLDLNNLINKKQENSSKEALYKNSPSLMKSSLSTGSWSNTQAETNNPVKLMMPNWEQKKLTSTEDQKGMVELPKKDEKRNASSNSKDLSSFKHKNAFIKDQIRSLNIFDPSKEINEKTKLNSEEFLKEIERSVSQNESITRRVNFVDDSFNEGSNPSNSFTNKSESSRPHRAMSRKTTNLQKVMLDICLDGKKKVNLLVSDYPSQYKGLIEVLSRTLKEVKAINVSE